MSATLSMAALFPTMETAIAPTALPITPSTGAVRLGACRAR